MSIEVMREIYKSKRNRLRSCRFRSWLNLQTRLFKVGVVRLPEDGMWAEFVDQTATQDGQEYFAFIVVPIIIKKSIEYSDSSSACNVTISYLIALLSFSYVMRGLFFIVPHKLASFSLWTIRKTPSLTSSQRTILGQYLGSCSKSRMNSHSLPYPRSVKDWKRKKRC